MKKKDIKRLKKRIESANDIWFDLYLGDLDMSNLGKSFEFPLIKIRGQITTTTIGDLEQHREELHKLFDRQFSKIVKEHNMVVEELKEYK